MEAMKAMMAKEAHFNLSVARFSDDKKEEYDYCWGVYPTNSLFLWLAIPSLAIIIVGSLLKQRIFSAWCPRRPGMMQPIDTFNPLGSRRFSYAAAFGLTTQLCLNLFLLDHLPAEFFEHTVVGKLKIHAIFRLACVLVIYVIALYPVFVAFYEDAVLGYLIATPYVWLVLAVELLNVEYCSRDLPEDVLQAKPRRAETNKYLRDNLPVYVSGYAVRMLPLLIYEVYLAISVPVSLITTIARWCRKRRGYYEKGYEEIRTTSAYIQVQECLMKRPEKEKHLEIKAVPVPFMKRVCNYFWPSVPGFRFSVRIMCTFVVATTTLYMISVDLIFDQWQMFNHWDRKLEHFEEILLKIDSHNILASIPPVAEGRANMKATYRIFKICFFFAISLALFTALLSILCAIAAIRIDIVAVYKGNHDKIPRSDISQAYSLVFGSMLYSGVQIAYIICGFLAHFVVFFVTSFSIGLLVQWEVMRTFIEEFIKSNWVTLMMPILVIIIQVLLARFLLTQGGQLALDNRKFYFNLIYALFFYNIILGLLSCLQRMFKAMTVGLVFLPRLDQSFMPQRFLTRDPGFLAYIGFLHVENAHTNPILLMFCYFMQRSLEAKAQQPIMTLRKSDKESHYVVEFHSMKQKHSFYAFSPSAKKVRNRFWVWHTLHHHPELRLLRKSHK